MTYFFYSGFRVQVAASPQKRKPTPPRCAQQPLPREGARVDAPSFLWKEVPRRGGGWRGKAVFPTHCLPLEGKVPRRGGWGTGGMKDKWENASQVRRLQEHPSADFFIKGRCQVAVFKSLVPSSPSSGSPYRSRRSQCVDRPQRSRTPVRASLYSPLRDGYRSGRCDGRRCRSHEERACRDRIRSA